MHNLLEIAKLLLTINTRHFERGQCDFSKIDYTSILYTPLYNKGGVKIALITDWDWCGNGDDEYYDEVEYLVSAGLTDEEQDRIEQTVELIYNNTKGVK